MDDFSLGAFAGEMDMGALALPDGVRQELTHDELLSDLTAQQRQAAMSNGPTLVLAGAGTGKTKTLTSAAARRLVEGVASQRLLAITFTNRAAREMKDRIEHTVGHSDIPWAGTFHGICCRLLRRAPEYAGLREGFDIVDAEDSLRMFKDYLKEIGNPVEKTEIKDILRAIGIYKDWLVTPDEAESRVAGIVEDMRRMNLPVSEAHLYQSIPYYKGYQRRLVETNKADFGDLIMWLTIAMERSPAVCDWVAGHWDVVLVDEYQDVNYAQYRFIQLIGSEHRQVFVVGDDDQAIYGFRNSNVAYIRQFTEDFEDASVIRLEENFRSTATILAAANAVISADEERLGKTLYTNGEKGFPINVVETHNSMTEAEVVCKAILNCRQHGLTYNDMVVIYRSNFLSRAYEGELARHKIPYRVIGDVSFYKRQEVKDVIALLRLSESYEDRQSDDAFRRMVNNPSRGIGAKKIEAIQKEAYTRGVSLARAAETTKLPPKARGLVDEFLRALQEARAKKLPLEEKASLLAHSTGYKPMWQRSDSEKAEERLQNIEEIIVQLGNFQTLEEALEYIALTEAHDSSKEDIDCVSLMTIHRSKGLEFPVGFLVGWEEEVMPSSMAIEEGRLDEERRLAYVALTRCKSHVFISGAHLRMGRQGFAPLSRFINDIPAELVRHIRY